MSQTPSKRALLLILCLTSSLATASCASDACRRRSTLDLGAPNGRVRAVEYHGRCESIASISTLSLSFKGDRGRTTVVIAERLRVVRLQWVHAERLEVDYHSENPGVIREQQVRAGADSVRVVFRGVSRRIR